MAFVIDLSAGLVCDNHLLLLEAGLHVSVRLDVVAGYGRPGAPLVARSSTPASAQPLSVVGSAQLDGTAVARASTTRRRLPAELVAMDDAPRAWTHPDVGHQLVLRCSALHGRAVLLSAVPGSRALASRVFDRRTGLCAGRIHGLDGLAADDERRSLDAAGLLVSAACGARRASVGQRFLEWLMHWHGMAERASSGTDLSDLGGGRSVALLHPQRRTS